MAWACAGPAGTKEGADSAGDLTDTLAQPDEHSRPGDVDFEVGLDLGRGKEARDLFLEDTVGQGGFGWPCETNEDCDSGFCIYFPDGPACTITCVEECPEGTSCVQAYTGEPDIIYICAPEGLNHCRPCLSHDNCKSAVDLWYEKAEVCASYGSEGDFCASICEADDDCPDGYECKDGFDMDKMPFAGCFRATGICECSPFFVAEAAATACSVGNEWGTCTGLRSCTENGLSECDAELPEQEDCDSVDNNCDGETDEGFDEDGNGLPDCVEVDEDEDGVPDGIDNCLHVPNEDQADNDDDGLGDQCDDDDDNDSIPDGVDNCPLVANASDGMADTDQDGKGDACDDDDDGDGSDDTDDCAPLDPTIFPEAEEICDGTDNNCNDVVDEQFPDTDEDGVADCVDKDDDSDGLSDDEDNCPLLFNPDQANNDEDEQGDKCDPDDDNDGIQDEVDNCPLVPNAQDGMWDTDQDGLGDACDGDDDNDGFPDEEDCDPLDAAVNPAAEEMCDLVDNDCDGLADEDLGSVSCGLGICLHTVDNCKDGLPQQCQSFEGAVIEKCDGLDNDCDGESDEELGSTACGTGICEHAVDNCADGELQLCDPFEGAVVEKCNGLDDDCDAEIDEELGTTACGLGECIHTIDNCKDGLPQQCDPFDGAVIEKCDGLDNDCDGPADEELGAFTCGLGPCKHSVKACVDGVEQVCDPTEGWSPEVCDGLDNDCDGEADDELDGLECSLENEFGTCPGTTVCNGLALTCEGPVAEVESCDGVDNDCDSFIDEGTVGLPCTNDNDFGSCKGKTLCIEGKPSCEAPFAQKEICDAADNDCNGLIDDLGTVTCGLGQCTHTIKNCAGGQVQVCDPMEGWTVEVCDTADNDCDGAIDEEIAPVTCGLGPCEHTVEACVDGVEQECDPFEGATDELCDQVDNDCDGDVDEGDACVSKVGCADATREGFTDLAAFPSVAACGGVWSGHIGGDSANQLCGQGWHVCSPAADGTDAAILKGVIYENATAFGGCFSYNAAQDYNTCIPCSGGYGSDDMGGAGSGCGYKVGNDPSCIGSGRVDSGCCSEYATDHACKYKPGLSGVVCCKQ